MRAKIRILIVIISGFICIGVAYFIGYGQGHTSAVRDDTKFGIVTYLDLYKKAKAEDTNRLQEDLRFFLFSYSAYYDRYFSNEVVTNASFLKDLEQARAVSSIERTQLVNFSPDAFVDQFNKEMRSNHQSTAEQEQNGMQKGP